MCTVHIPAREKDRTIFLSLDSIDSITLLWVSKFAP